MTAVLIVPAVLGWIAGWLVNYLADVLPVTRRLSPPACLQCGTPIALKEYLLFQACPNGHARKARVWITQVLVLAVSMYTWLQPPPKIGYLPGMLLLVYFGVIVAVDMEHRLILHPTSIAGSLLALTLGLFSNGLLPTLLGGLGGLLIMLAFYYMGTLFSRIRARRMRAMGQEADDEEALGAGDVILVTILGFLVGWPLIWFCILFSILLGGFVSLLFIVWLFVSRKYEKNALMMFIPYGPYFIAGAFLIVYFPRFLEMLVPG